MMGIPTLVIGGYLGAGKTTLLNHILRHANGQRIAVLVNDFGDINIDADLIEGQFGDIVELSGGCVCCSFGADLVGGLAAVAKRVPAPNWVLIETSGVALPGAVARSARLVQSLNVRGVLTVLDASTIAVQVQARYVGSTVLQQIQDAQLLLLNKVDLPTPADLIKTQTWLAGVAVGVSVIEATQAELPPDFWDLLKGRLGKPSPPRGEWKIHGLRMAPSYEHTQASDQFESRSWEFKAGVDVQKLKTELDAEPKVLRAKGLVRDKTGKLWVLQKVGAVSSVTSSLALDAEIAEEPATGQLVLISLRGDMPDGTFLKSHQTAAVSG